MDSTKVIILGGKGTAVVVAEQIHDSFVNYNKKYEFLGFAFDDENYGNEINGFPVLSKTNNVWDKYKKYNDVQFVFQMYRQDILPERIKLQQSYGIETNRFCTFVHPSCMVSRSANIGLGTVVMAFTVINPNAKIGKFCTIQSHVTIGHDAKLGDYNFIATQATIANLTMGERNFVGINASTNNFITIGDDCFIGMASNVIKDVQSGTKVYGNPAKPFEKPLKAF